MNPLALEILGLVDNATNDFLHRLVGKILESTEVHQIRRYGPHVVTTYKDGRKIVHTVTRYPSETVYGPTAYEMLQLGEEVPFLGAPPAMPPWLLAGLAIPTMLAGYAASLGRPR